MKNHFYNIALRWTGNTGLGTSSYTTYQRDYQIAADGKPVIYGSSDPAFRGDATRYNPEDMLVSSLSACHMLWYLHLCSAAGVVVIAYSDNATGTLCETAVGGGHFTEVILRPMVIISEPGQLNKANKLHEEAHRSCFIANSCNFPIILQPSCKTNDSNI